MSSLQTDRGCNLSVIAASPRPHTVRIPQPVRGQSETTTSPRSLPTDGPGQFEETIEKTLRHLDLWEGPIRRTNRAPPMLLESGYIREPFYNDIPFGPETYAE
jgi:hypothetical protein